MTNNIILYMTKPDADSQSQAADKTLGGPRWPDVVWVRSVGLFILWLGPVWSVEYE